jgi:class 3 adenylate cyclase
VDQAEKPSIEGHRRASHWHRRYDGATLRSMEERSGVERPPPRPTAGERRIVSVLVADIAGSTSIAEQLGPERSTYLFDEVVRLMRDEVERVGGTIALLLKVRSYKPDVAIVDIKMPPTQTDEGLRAAKEIREKYPDTAVLVLSQYVEEGYALELLQGSAEGVGYLLKDRVYDLADFVAAVKRVAEGGSALDPTVVSQLVGRRRSNDPLDSLSAREQEVQRTDGRRALQLGDRSARVPDRTRRREARDEHLPEASPPSRRRHAPARARGRRLLEVLARSPR